MTDAKLVLLWVAVLAAGIGATMGLRAAGLARTYVRDLLHVGAGIWILGWPYWHDAVAPIGICAVAAIAVASVPVLARHVGLAARFRNAVSDGNERFAGLIVYTVAYLMLTTVGLLVSPFPAGAGLLALSLGDGIGGAVGRRFGRHAFHVPRGKKKTLEGSLTVALAATAGALIASRLFDVLLAPWAPPALGAVAAAAEAIAPRSSDNAIVPAAVWLAATLAH
jgi:phytol kinase